MSQDTRTRQGRRKGTKNKSKNKKTIFKKVVIALFVFISILTVAGAITIFSIIKDAPELDPENLKLAQTPEIFDQNDEFFATLSATENRRFAEIDEIPPLLQDAFISVEDVRFREHFGIDIRRIGGALKANITSGFGAEGASTITQQVVKNLFLSNEKKLQRKIQEQYLAIKLEQQYSKDQILEMYLNAIYFSEGAYGVVEAADRYFSKSLDELTIEDAALLAGIPQRPNYYNPLINPEPAEKRRNTVIALMKRHGKITAEQAEQAMAIPVEEQLNPSNRDDLKYEAFMNEVQRELEQIEGLSSSDIYTGGIKIYTTLDQNAQSYTENHIQNYQFPNDELKTGLTVVDTQTGAIRAIGYRLTEEGLQRGFNYATQAERSPGSTIKPILDYGPVIEHKQWSTYHQIIDEPYTYSDGKPFQNFGNKYEHGPMSMRRALLLSKNVPAVKAFQAVGPQKAKAFGEGLGIPNLDTINEAYAIGGFATGVSSRDIAGAYAAFGNEGIYNKPYTVRKIEFPDGRVIDLTPESHVAMNDYTAFMISDMLKSAVYSPSATGRNARIDGLPMAGKTGTSNDNADRWFAGYTTKYSIAVWTGYNDQRKPVKETQIALELFRSIMTELSKDKTTEDFKQPDSVVRVGIEKTTGLLPSEYTPKDEIIYEYFVRGTEPTEQSEAFIKPTTPTDMMGAYDEESDQIVVTWNYPDEERKTNSFTLQLSIDNSDFEVISLDKEMQHIIFNPIKGSSYRFKLFAVSDSNDTLVSDSVELNVEVPEPEVEDPSEGTGEEDEELTDVPDPLDNLPDDDTENEGSEGETPQDNNQNSEDDVETEEETNN